MTGIKVRVRQWNQFAKLEIDHEFFDRLGISLRVSRLSRLDCRALNPVPDLVVLVQEAQEVGGEQYKVE